MKPYTWQLNRAFRLSLQNKKPHIFFSSNSWFCASPDKCARGVRPAKAYMNWLPLGARL